MVSVTKGSVTERDGLLLLKSPYAWAQKARALPGARWNPTEKAWMYPADAQHRTMLEKAFGSLLEVDGRQVTPSVDLYSEGIGRRRMRNEPIPVTKTEPWPHQVEAYWVVEEHPGSALLLDMGCGKSLIVVDYLNSHPECQRTVILCPLAVIPAWEKQFAQHAAREFTLLPLTDKLTATQKAEKVRELLRRTRRTGESFVIVVNYESAWQPALAAVLLAQRWDVGVADEMHRIKSPFGKASTFVAQFGTLCDKRIGLTGTPLPHSYIDIFAQYRFLDPTIFGPSYYAFEARYAVKGGFDGKQIVDWKNVEELQEKIHRIAYRVRAEDVLSLPPFRDVVLGVELESPARKHYRQLETQFITEVGQGVVTVSNALVKLLRLQQLTGGWLTDEEGREHHVSTAKKRALTDLITDMAHDEPVVVFCRFHKDLDTVHDVSKSLGRGSGELSGRRRELDRWQAGDFPVLAVQWQAGGVGVDFTRARYCVMYSTGFSGGDYEQGRKRVHRPGQDRPVVYYHLVAEHTVDAVVYRALASKQDLAEAVLDYARGKR